MIHAKRLLCGLLILIVDLCILGALALVVLFLLAYVQATALGLAVLAFLGIAYGIGMEKFP